ncbi:serine hydrolase domain-containing protein [Nocardia sp. GCM10030253]|uniref:serine hydrolase domain-containing protein n=1 Tax=Nocardia sp. GCM10030253 TaxID=3273404 RepID=UPI003643DDD5
MNILRGYSTKVALSGMAIGAIFAATACNSATSTPAAPTAAPSQSLTQAVNQVVESGFPGVQAVIDGPGGHRVLTAGVGDLQTGAPFAADAQVRIGSNTKTFVTTVILQLVAEGKVELDAPIERYLPDVVQGNGNDGNRITVRQLMQHTSGIPDYLGHGTVEGGMAAEGSQLDPTADAIRWRQYEPADLVRRAMTMPPNYEPGARAEYTNTNYIVLGMLIDKVTGQSPAAEITRRIIEPLGLRATYFPAPGDTGIRDPHPSGYHQIDGKRVDFTITDTSWAGAAGAMISTGADVNRFFIALLDGKLLPAAQLAEMQRTVPFDREPGAGYGLGLIHRPVPCGKEVWGHGGSIPGFEVRTGVAADGTAVTVTSNQLPTSRAAFDAVEKVFEIAICGG